MTATPLLQHNTRCSYRKALIVDDNSEAGKGVQDLLPSLNSVVTSHACSSGVVGTFKPDVIVIAMKAGLGPELKRLLHRTAGIPILALIYPAHEPAARQALHGRVSDFLIWDRVNAYVLEKSIDYLARMQALLPQKG